LNVNDLTHDYSFTRKDVDAIEVKRKFIQYQKASTVQYSRTQRVPCNYHKLYEQYKYVCCHILHLLNRQIKQIRTTYKRRQLLHKDTW